MKENKLIAEFMDFPTQRDAVDNGTIAYYVGESIMHTNNTNNQNDYDVFHPEDMQFHTSWDWLMPVVEKINNTTDEFGNEMDFQIGNGFVWVDHPIGNRIYFSGNEIDHKKEPMIDKVYKAVVEFIQWYNQKN